MEQEFGLLNDDEVLHVDAGRVLMTNPTFKVSEFLDALAQLVSEREIEWSDTHEGWFSNGLSCEALRFGNRGWQRGRVRVRLEFVPEPQPKLLREMVSDRSLPETPRQPAKRDDIYSRDDVFNVYPKPDENY